VWNTAAGKAVLKYDENGPLPVNLVYDSREATTQKNQNIQGSIDSDKQAADSVKNEYTALKEGYASDSAAHNGAVQAYESELDAYNTEVDYWNGRGGAPKSEYERLAAEKDDLDAKRASLETQRDALNAEADRINALIDRYNLVAEKVNANIAAVNQSAGREFEEGEYVSDASGTRVNIYEFESEQKLVRVLAHEFGHALGLSHNGNPDSIMYYLNQSTNLTPTADDIAALKALCAAAN
jgi:chromosome segregation ATPase